MKDGASIWSHRAPADNSWYWRKLNAIKVQMQNWYSQGRYILAQNGDYSITKSYLAIIGQQPRMKTAELVWTSMALPKHHFITWLAVQGRLLTLERKLKLHIQLDDTDCCLCDGKVMESNEHLFEKCVWVKALENNGIKQALEGIKTKHWKKGKKETIVAICGAILCHVWQARN
ncbi:hypothetical protein R3W88_019275 [Solanum pinnatisectum]|uniref:Reverse transcriptase zinc-binding domain-containing protein n=1 Tax=Solanum pinnatisectum TaxID=50273 RepID=A0AAV9KKE9_9SOLN|nr:hypothetical protein R3W88_019275 [Solanum pinnatisectum]